MAENSLALAALEEATNLSSCTFNSLINIGKRNNFSLSPKIDIFGQFSLNEICQSGKCSNNLPLMLKTKDNLFNSFSLNQKCKDMADVVQRLVRSAVDCVSNTLSRSRETRVRLPASAFIHCRH